MQVEPVHWAALVGFLSPFLLKGVEHLLKRSGYQNKELARYREDVDKEVKRYRDDIDEQLEDCRRGRDADRERIVQLVAEVAALRTNLEWCTRRMGS